MAMVPTDLSATKQYGEQLYSAQITSGLGSSPRSWISFAHIIG
jgi:hypothetical protein